MQVNGCLELEGGRQSQSLVLTAGAVPPSPLPLAWSLSEHVLEKAYTLLVTVKWYSQVSPGLSWARFAIPDVSGLGSH